MEHRIKQLELKLAEQERVNAAMCEDIKSLKEIQNGDRKEYRTSFEHYEEKKKKFSAVLREVNGRTTALQDQQERLATKAELQ
jgi:inorganic pyrophosphatase